MRTGSTYLSTILDEHPEIEMIKPYSPEPKFFVHNKEYSKEDGVLYNSEHFPKHAKFRGEKTVHYCELDHVPQTLNKLFPESKIILLVRHPLFRAVSNYLYTLKNGNGIEGLSIAEALSVKAEERCLTYDKNAFATCPLNYLQRGLYIQAVNRFLKIYDPDRFKIVLFEELTGNLNEIRNILTFLGADSNFTPDNLNTYVNSGEILTANFVTNILSPEHIRSLMEYFAPYNEQLENSGLVSLDIWKKLNEELLNNSNAEYTHSGFAD